jgi:MoxR-like ATPase
MGLGGGRAGLPNDDWHTGHPARIALEDTPYSLLREESSATGALNLPIPPPDFEGREVDMYRVITNLLARRLVTLTGDLGMGKSALAAAICSYVADRSMFLDGVVYLRLQGVSTHEEFLATVLRGLMAGPARVTARLEYILNTRPKFGAAVSNIKPAQPTYR